MISEVFIYERVSARAEKISNLQYTHFISLPLSSHKDLVEQLRSFKMNVLNEEKEADTYVSWFPESAEKESFNASAVNITDRISQSKSSRIMDPDLERFFSDDDESSDDENELHESSPGKVSSYYFIRPETVHITVLMLKLLTDERVKVAAEVLEGIRPKVLEILDGREPKVVLRGLIWNVLRKGLIRRSSRCKEEIEKQPLICNSYVYSLVDSHTGVRQQQLGERTHIDWAVWDASPTASYGTWCRERLFPVDTLAEHFHIGRGTGQRVIEIESTIPDAWDHVICGSTFIPHHQGWWGILMRMAWPFLSNISIYSSQLQRTRTLHTTRAYALI
ncbi:hypothetical protein L7F22_034853 [Adiantum nelumboides]|nr:hypothetical protein [Adiantum nelumboides]